MKKTLKEHSEAKNATRALGAAEGDKSEEKAKQKHQGDQKEGDHEVSLSDDDSEDEYEYEPYTDSTEEIARRIAKEDL